MSDSIKHECGIALVRLLKPLSYYHQKYGTALYGLDKLYLLMEKQHNRGQDGAGIAAIKLDMQPGMPYINRYRAVGAKAVAELFEYVQRQFVTLWKENAERMNDMDWLKQNTSFTGEVLMGHLRYGTHGENRIENCHPFLRQNNWMTRNLVIAGNFNMTNVDELLQQLYELGQHPKGQADTVTVLEKIGHFLDTENQELFDQFKSEGYSNIQISHQIAEQLDVVKILRRSAKTWDGGYTITGVLGHGDAFVMRDPVGIRPAFYYQDSEVVVVTSERPAIQTAFNVPFDHIKEIQPGHALIIKKNGLLSEQQFSEPMQQQSCSFERIYFSRGSDAEIYRERKELGRLLCEQVLDAVDHDLENTVFSHIPNTAEIAFYGLSEGIHAYIKKVQKEALLCYTDQLADSIELDRVLDMTPRIEKIAVKDVKLRTFITQDADRKDLVAHVYDTTYGLIRNGVDTLVVLDDSIVRGTTLKQSILKILDRLGPKRILVVSSAPQIRYPDCYGIDMSRMAEFVAFEAAISLLKERGQEQVIQEVYQNCVHAVHLGSKQTKNYVQQIYQSFTDQEIADRIAEMISPKGIKAKVQVIYQSIVDLHRACPKHTGDWYFSGNYPTLGGNKVANRAFMNWVEGKDQRAY
ncbi:MAG: amidophosphoribosyltransferase [Pedobacter sp.]|nr:MAG: amidophosphoribosyltransferase [Pedobacter sp.]